MGLGLCGLVVLDAHQDLVEAHGLNITDLPNRFQQSQRATQVELTSANSRAQHLAVNTAPIENGLEPNVSEVDPSQLATANQWSAASFPVENFQSYTSPFGYRLSPTGGYSQEFHYGLDLAAPQGSYIRNWWGGKVVEVTDNSNCGTSVVIESGNWLHIYCHMQGHVESGVNGRYMIDREGGLQIWEGQAVQAGERIGRVGMTGRTTGPHLHWGLKYDSNWVDPAHVLRAMYVDQRNAQRH
jgi:murein DD-endopeptidase MepM/ murein hydrolase activator NlpD